MKSDGYSLDQKRDFLDGKGDIPDVIEKFRADRIESRNAVLVGLSQIKKNNYNLSISRYKQDVHEEISYEDPQVLLESVARLEEKIAKELQELKAMI